MIVKPRQLQPMYRQAFHHDHIQYIRAWTRNARALAFQPKVCCPELNTLAWKTTVRVGWQRRSPWVDATLTGIDVLQVPGRWLFVTRGLRGIIHASTEHDQTLAIRQLASRQPTSADAARGGSATVRYTTGTKYRPPCTKHLYSGNGVVSPSTGPSAAHPSRSVPLAAIWAHAVSALGRYLQLALGGCRRRQARVGVALPWLSSVLRRVSLKS